MIVNITICDGFLVQKLRYQSKYHSRIGERMMKNVVKYPKNPKPTKYTHCKSFLDVLQNNEFSHKSLEAKLNHKEPLKRMNLKCKNRNFDKSRNLWNQDYKDLRENAPNFFQHNNTNYLLRKEGNMEISLKQLI